SEGGKTRDKLSVMHRSATGLLNTVNQLLDFGKITETAKEEKLCPSYFKLKDEFEGMLLQFIELAAIKPIHFTWELLGQEWMVFCDRDKIHKIVRNLLSNAFKFTPAKGFVDFQVSVSEGWVHLTVKDSGIGMKKEDQARI